MNLLLPTLYQSLERQQLLERLFQTRSFLAFYLILYIAWMYKFLSLSQISQGIASLFAKPILAS